MNCIYCKCTHSVVFTFSFSEDELFPLLMKLLVNLTNPLQLSPRGYRVSFLFISAAIQGFIFNLSCKTGFPYHSVSSIYVVNRVSLSQCFLNLCGKHWVSLSQCLLSLCCKSGFPYHRVSIYLVLLNFPQP